MDDSYQMNAVLAENFKMYADYLAGIVSELQSVETLPVIGVRREVRARQIAIGYLKPAMDKFRIAAEGHKARAMEHGGTM